MAELVDPQKLISIVEAAKEFGFHPKYFSLLAAKGKIKAWYIGKSWITLREHVEQYLSTSRPRGRPRKTKPNKRK